MGSCGCLKEKEEKMTRKLLADENAQAFGFDFLIAIGIFMGAFLVSYYMLSYATTAYYGESAAISPVAHRVSEILIKDTGEPDNWDSEWAAGTYTTTKRIGLSDRSQPNVLNRTKLNALMPANTSGANTWWEFGEYATNGTRMISTVEYENASIALGLNGDSPGGYRGYDCYIQVIPTNGSSFDSTYATTAFNAARDSTSGDIVSIERLIVVPIIRDADYDYDYYKMKMLVW